MNKIKRSHLQGDKSPFFKTGIGVFISYRKEQQLTYCERCNKDLSQAGRYEWCTHHKDHNRNNNNIDNFELLCKKCHQLEHKCYNQLKVEYTKECFICNNTFISKANNALYCEKCNPLYRRFKHKYSKEEIKQMIIEGKV